jgi:hypothetical protein
MRNKVRYVLKHVLDDLYELGKGVKRGKLQREMKELTGIRESHFIHTSKTKVRYEQAVMKFVDFLEENGIKRQSHLNKKSTEELQEVIDSYFERLAEEEYSKSTIKLHIAALEKTIAIVRPDIKEYLTDDENRIGWWSAGVDSRKRGSYVNPEAIRERLKEEHRMIAEAQSLAGFRVREIAKAEVDKENERIIIHKAKGGRTRELSFEHRKEDFERLADLIEKLQEQEYQKHLKDYYRDIKNACKATGEEYRASHAFRYEYAERRIEKLKENKEELKDLLDRYGADEKTKECVNDENTIEQAADYVLTRELGHNRTSMSRYYYR